MAKWLETNYSDIFSKAEPFILNKKYKLNKNKVITTMVIRPLDDPT